MTVFTKQKRPVEDGFLSSRNGVDHEESLIETTEGIYMGTPTFDPEVLSRPASLGEIRRLQVSNRLPASDTPTPHVNNMGLHRQHERIPRAF